MMREDLEQICASEYIPWEDLRGKTVLITGASGLIGSHLVNALLYASEVRGLGVRVLALVREEQKGKKIFERQLLECGKLQLVVGDVRDRLAVDGRVDYIIHGAGPTSSRFFMEHPVETVETVVCGTSNMLRMAREHHVKGFLLLSTMEVYGCPEKGHKVTEDDAGALSSAKVRNSYPIGKLAGENLCCAYAREYQLPAEVVRLTQTFGPGVEYSDSRVFAEFARCGIEKRSIVLKTEGETERSYLYTADAVTAIFTVLLKGAPGQIYTAANEETYCSIYDMAKLAGELFGVDVVVNEQDISQFGYADVLYMDLDAGKLRTLGWDAATGLRDMYRRMGQHMAKDSGPRRPHGRE